MQTILVATDFSTRSDRALRRATLLAKSMSRALALVHVVDDDQPERLLAAERRAAEELISDLARTIQSVDGIPCRADVLVGEPFEVVEAAAAAASADLVVMGPHRRQALRDMFVGTTVQRTIARASRPVLMANAVPSRPYSRILFATDLSDSADRAVEVMFSLGLPSDAEKAIVHVYDAPAEGLLFRSAVTMDERKDYLRQQEADARLALDRHLSEHGIQIHTRFVRLVELSVANTIRDCARAYSADLIVVGTRGRSGVERFMLGSVAEDVLASSEVDVFAVPPTE